MVDLALTMTVLQLFVLLLSGILALIGVLISQLVASTVIYLPGWLALVLLILIALPLFRRGFDIFAPVTLVAGMHLGFVLGTWISISNNMAVIGMEVSGRLGARVLSRTLVYIIFGLMCYYLGYYWTLRGNSTRKQADSLPKRQLNVEPEVYWFIAAYIVVGVLMYYLLFVRRMGGVGTLVAIFGQTSSRRRLMGNSGASAYGIWLILTAHSLWFPYYLDHRKGGILFWVYSVFVLMVELLNASALTAHLLTWCTSLVIRYRYSASGLQTKTRTFILVGMVLVVPLLVVYGYRASNVPKLIDQREHVMKELFTVNGFIEKMVVETRNVADINILTQIVQGVPKDIPFQHGSTLWIFARNLYAQLFNQYDVNTRTIGQILRDRWYDSVGGGRPPTFLGELYLNFGVIGIMLGMFLLGILSSHLYRWMITSQNRWVQFVYSVVVFWLAMLIKADISNIMIAMIFWTTPVIVTLVFIRMLRSFNTELMKSNKRLTGI